MKPERRQGAAGTSQNTGLGQMPGSRHKHQQQGHHQLAPALPPVALALPLVTAAGQVVLPGPGLVAKPLQAMQQGRQALLRMVEPEPGGAAEQAHTHCLHARLLAETLLDGPNAAAAFHTHDLQQQRASGAVLVRSESHGSGNTLVILWARRVRRTDWKQRLSLRRAGQGHRGARLGSAG